MYAKSCYNFKVIIRFRYSIVTITTGNITLKSEIRVNYSGDE